MNKSKRKRGGGDDAGNDDGSDDGDADHGYTYTTPEKDTAAGGSSDGKRRPHSAEVARRPSRLALRSSR